jgi:predicted permease
MRLISISALLMTAASHGVAQRAVTDSALNARIDVLVEQEVTAGRFSGQLLTESGVLTAIAGVVGIMLAFGLVQGLVAVSPPGVPRIEQARVDGPLLLLTLAVSVACSLAVGLAPAFRAADSSPYATLRESGRGTGETKKSQWSRAGLVAAEVALTMALLGGAGLLIRTAWAISHVDPGFDADHLLTAQVVLPATRYPDMPSGVQAYRRITDEIGRTPGVRSAALTSSLPFATSIRAGVGAAERPQTDGERLIATARLITPKYFSTMKTRLSGGREFSPTDDANASNVVIVNAALAKRLWPGERAVGQRMEGMDPSHQHFMAVVGEVADTRDVALSQPAAPEFYIPFEQTPPMLWAGVQGSLTIVARTTAAPETMERAIRGAVHSVEPGVPLAKVATMNSLVRSSRATERFNTLLLSAFGGIGLLLASIGVYGVIAYSVSQRTREIGLRIALGATPVRVATLVVGQGLMPVAAGALAGGGLSLMTARLLRDQLYGVPPADPMTMVLVGAVVFVVAVIAACIPTRRAMSISPATALAE